MFSPRSQKCVLCPVLSREIGNFSIPKNEKVSLDKFSCPSPYIKGPSGRVPSLFEAVPYNFTANFLTAFFLANLLKFQTAVKNFYLFKLQHFFCFFVYLFV